MLAFEAALARAEARAGVIPLAAADAIGAGCQTDDVDVAAIYHEAAVAGSPAIPLVRLLTARVAAEGRDFVHWGATSQDAIDTATVLQMRDGLMLLEGDLFRLGAACAALADGRRRTLMAGRTLLQQALPIPFGLKAARWLGLVTRQVRALRDQRWALALQFGGASGTLAALGDQGLRIAELLAAELALALPDLPWHAERDRVAGIAVAVGVTAGAMAKVAQDVVLLAQTEVGEVAEARAPGKGGSSAMPQKRNPVDATLERHSSNQHWRKNPVILSGSATSAGISHASLTLKTVGMADLLDGVKSDANRTFDYLNGALALAAARLAVGQVPVILAAMVQEHERAVGGWQAEWAAIPDPFRFAGGAVAHVAQAVAGLQVDAGRMRANVEQGGGLLMAEALTMAITPHLGRLEAQRVVQAACMRATDGGRSLRQAALEDARVRAVLSPVEIERALDPDDYLGSADALIDRALEGYRAIGGGDEWSM